MTTVAYLRASPGCDDLQAQQEAVHGWAIAHAITISATYRDGPGRSSAGRSALLRAVEAGDVEKVIVARPCRLAPTLPLLLSVLRRLRDAGVEVEAVAGQSEGLRMLGLALPTITAVREGHHREAVALGRARAKEAGVRFGRPPVAAERVARLGEALSAGASLRAAARRAGVGVATASRLRAVATSRDARERLTSG